MCATLFIGQERGKTESIIKNLEMALFLTLEIEIFEHLTLGRVATIGSQIVIGPGRICYQLVSAMS